MMVVAVMLLVACGISSVIANFAGAAAVGTTVDLGYGVYTGVDNNATGLTVWKGIRYAAAPVGTLRWQAPQIPPVNRTNVIASQFGPSCPQAYPTMRNSQFFAGNEDCLYLSVWAPSKSVPGNISNTSKTGLPVLLSIHGGGYGLGDGTQDMAGLINDNDNRFLVVVIQYRLGAFGFLSSSEIRSRGVLNAGLLDQNFALQWIQNNIALFGGNPSRVTIFGESAGGGSALLHGIAKNASLGTSLFNNIIAASPWTPTQPQPRFNDDYPVRYYNAFTNAAGCRTGNLFDCLVAKDSFTLQRASNKVSSTEPPYGNWAFFPVTDDTYVTGSVITSLEQRKVNGLRVLVGVNANEGALFVPTNITTQNDMSNYLKTQFYRLTDYNITQILANYPSRTGPASSTDPRYETNGIGPGTAVNISQAATGQQQRTFNIYSEAEVLCLAYSLATAFSGDGHAAYFYQYSVPFAVHGADVAAYYGPAAENQGPGLIAAFRRIYGNFIVQDNPSISDSVANEPPSPGPGAFNPASNWPPWTADRQSPLVNLNQSGGTPYLTYMSTGVAVTQFRQPGLRNNLTVANAYAWEGGRGQRCEFWREQSRSIVSSN